MSDPVDPNSKQVGDISFALQVFPLPSDKSKAETTIKLKDGSWKVSYDPVTKEISCNHVGMSADVGLPEQIAVINSSLATAGLSSDEKVIPANNNNMNLPYIISGGALDESKPYLIFKIKGCGALIEAMVDDGISSEIEILTQRLERVKRTLENEKKNNEDLEKQLDKEGEKRQSTVNGMNTRHKAELDNKDKEIGELEKALSEKSKELDGLISDKFDLKRDLLSEQGRVVRLEKDLDQASKNTPDNLLQRCAEAEARATGLENDLEKAQKEFADEKDNFTFERENLNRQIQALLDQSTGWQTTAQSVQGQLVSTMQEVGQWKEQATQLQKRLDDTAQNAQDWRIMANGLRGQLGSAINLSNELQSNVQKLSTQLDTAQYGVNQLQQQLTAAAHENSRLDDKLDEANFEIEGLNRTLNQTEKNKVMAHKHCVLQSDVASMLKDFHVLVSLANSHVKTRGRNFNVLSHFPHLGHPFIRRPDGKLGIKFIFYQVGKYGKRSRIYG
ncbi:hypothetical protein TWF102_010311 [Orbilia oligospora]|uniref:Uncharacterized protein n=1 Tax=Orbilia oligospora TaxID=2813651 RepID=A0A7C8J5Z9_ORBOL|nr:hypothetical protein TWF102_010311 [Orbilia oligospora]KAF3108840.1 hypothetical protein TWF103_005431 [Orbilia oligospora]